MDRPRTTRHRRNALWLAAMVHRVSGVLLALFLPVHFLVLGLALEGAARLDGFLKLTQLAAARVAEGVLVFLLAVHLVGGLRVLVIENLPWRANQKQLATAATAFAALIGLLFWLQHG
jgi:fumarate reductase subunit D